MRMFGDSRDVEGVNLSTNTANSNVIRHINRNGSGSRGYIDAFADIIRTKMIIIYIAIIIIKIKTIIMINRMIVILEIKSSKKN
jgi:hypothetical protein